MQNLSTILLVMFMAMFWVLRIIVAVTTEFGLDFPITTLNMEMEIGLLFVALLCMILVIRRNLLGGIIYIVAYGMYFGVDMYNNITEALNGGTISQGVSAFASLIGVIIAVAVLIDLLADKKRKINPSNPKTDWFYKNEEYDRQFDERADKNQYKF